MEKSDVKNENNNYNGDDDDIVYIVTFKESSKSENDKYDKISSRNKKSEHQLSNKNIKRKKRSNSNKSNIDEEPNKFRRIVDPNVDDKKNIRFNSNTKSIKPINTTKLKNSLKPSIKTEFIENPVIEKSNQILDSSSSPLPETIHQESKKPSTTSENIKLDKNFIFKSPKNHSNISVILNSNTSNGSKVFLKRNIEKTKRKYINSQASNSSIIITPAENLAKCELNSQSLMSEELQLQNLESSIEISTEKEEQNKDTLSNITSKPAINQQIKTPIEEISPENIIIKTNHNISLNTPTNNKNNLLIKSNTIMDEKNSENDVNYFKNSSLSPQVKLNILNDPNELTISKTTPNKDPIMKNCNML